MIGLPSFVCYGIEGLWLYCVPVDWVAKWILW